MGETGIGKTSLIRLLSTIMDNRLYIMNVHAGTTKKQPKTAGKRANQTKTENKNAHGHAMNAPNY